MNLILASASPRRKKLMELAGYEFTTEVSDVDESVIEGAPKFLVERLSSLKAEAVARKHQLSKAVDKGSFLFSKEMNRIIQSNQSQRDISVVIGADTIVVRDQEILGKPKDKKDAFCMLKELSGRTHQVYTGVTLLVLENGSITKHISFSECTDVTMRSLSDEEIHEYISGGEPMDKAGAYGIQGKAAVFISGIRGDYYNVVGLPICRLTEEMKNVYSSER